MGIGQRKASKYVATSAIGYTVLTSLRHMLPCRSGRRIKDERFPDVKN